MHRLVIVGSSIEFIRLVQMAGEMGIYTIVCDGYKDGPAKAYADKAYDIDVRDEQAVAKMCIEEKADGIIGSFSDLLFEQITKAAGLAGLRWYAKPDMLDVYRDKGTQKALLKELGIRVPQNRLLGEDFTEADLEGMRFPLVIKPVDGYGSRGIFVVHDAAELKQLFARVNSAGSGTKVLCEEYSQGPEYNMMSWLYDGVVYPLSIADREKNPQKGTDIPSDNRNVYPSVNIDEVYDEAREILQKFADRTGQKEGALSMQFFKTPEGIEVCEIAGRLLGYEHELITYSTGLDIEKLLLDYVYDPEEAGRTLKNYDARTGKIYAVVYFFTKLGSVIADQREARQVVAEMPDILQADFFYKDNEVTDKNHPYFMRAYIGAETREELDRKTEYLFSRIHAYDEAGKDVVLRPVIEKSRLTDA
ncbi:MAG: ATP-grasp domain-containing protein [Solobacterium sp.]|nr:ATP-grasp domain-containing protein [Solobacterium sp.]